MSGGVNFLILMCGLPGTGKTTVTAKLVGRLSNYLLLDQNEIRRKLGYKESPVIISDDPKLKERDISIANKTVSAALQSGKGVIYDAVNKFSCRRHQLYGIASSCNADVLVLEVVCPEDVSKSRMSARPNSDGLLSDPNDTRIYDKIKQEWQSIEGDFQIMIMSHVSHIRYDSHANRLSVIIARKEAEYMIAKIEEILVKGSAN